MNNLYEFQCLALEPSCLSPYNEDIDEAVITTTVASVASLFIALGQIKSPDLR